MAGDGSVSTAQTVISVIIPLFNCEAFIEEALESVSSQTVLNNPRVRVEISICDDGSSDRGLEIVDAWKQNSKSVTVLASRNPINLGPGESRNVAVRQSSGEYLAMLDADDVMLPDRLQKQLEALLASPQPDATIVGCHFQRFPIDSTPRYQVRSTGFVRPVALT